ncbi:MAG: polyprenyl synthetase family protein [Paracoccaceae bacterium]|nr:polyprenyl synthetase family protein [Paracoccaceae bacterium]
MKISDRIEETLLKVLRRAKLDPAPPKLAAALNYSVFPGGARVRPQLALSVSIACGDDNPKLSNASAIAIELIHCASLIHDDLPCFDDASIRRGKPSLHKAFNEPIAVLAGDALIMMAFEILGISSDITPERLPTLIGILGRSGGMPFGICSGQGWESEPEINLSAYHQLKTGSLFVAATQMGAISAGEDPEPWEELGARIGEAFQVADDVRDALETSHQIGKPTGQDLAKNRPNAVNELGVAGAIEKLQDILSGAISSIPSCPGEADLCEIVRKQAALLTPINYKNHNI